MSKKGLLQKIDFLLSIAKNQEYTDNDLAEILELVNEHSEHMVLGRFMGYSVSDYALATLKWLEAEETQEKFDFLYNTLPQKRRNEVTKLISEKLYLQY